MWCLPTHKRPEKLLRFVASLAPMDWDENVVLMLWRDDPRRDDYARIFDRLPRAWDVWICPERLCGDKLNAAFRAFPNERFYGFLSDDIQLGTHGMLKQLRMEAENGHFTWPNDDIHGARLATHPVAPGDFIRALGFWAHPEFPHNGLDTVLYYVAECLGIGKFRGDLNIIVRHPTATGHIDEDDETYRDAREMNQKAIDTMYKFQDNKLAHLVQRMRDTYGKSRQVSARFG